MYVRWVARFVVNDLSGLKKIDLPLHLCTKDDLADFYPVREIDQEAFDELT